MGQTSQLSGVDESDLSDLIEYGVLIPADPATEPRTFDIKCVMKLQRPAIMRQDLALDSQGLTLAMMFLNQIAGLEDQLHNTQRDLRGCRGLGDGCSKRAK